jgi:nucleotide-binding universal stress UspA family protein
MPTPDRGASAADAAPEAERAEALLETVREETGVEAHLRWRGSSSVGRALHELCELIGADLVTVGSARRGLLGRVLIGDDTSAALNGAPLAHSARCPLLLLTRTARPSGDG